MASGQRQDKQPRIKRYSTVASRFNFLVRQLAKKYPDFRRLRFHNLRHLLAVDWLRSGRSIYDLQHRLGHTSISDDGDYLKFLTAEEQRVVKAGFAAACP